MARLTHSNSRSGSPTRRDHPRREYESRNDYDGRPSRRGVDSEEPRSTRETTRNPKYRDEEDLGGDDKDERGGRNDRYKRRRYEGDEARDRDGYKYERRSEPRERERERERERSPDGDRRRKRDRDTDGDNRKRDYYAAERGERRERGYVSDREERRRDYRERRGERRNRDDERQPPAGPSTTSRRHSRAPSSPRSRSRPKSPSSDKGKEKEEGDKEKDKSKPNFNQSGILAAATNTVKLADGTAAVLKYNEPPEARKPSVGWRLYVFKGKEQTDLLHISRQSCYLIGRDKNIVDIILDHPSCSKQHAVIQHRQVQERDEFGASKAVVKPFIIDLESTNSTFVNDEAIPQARYYELKMGDVIKFGMSTREYVLLSDDA